MRERVTMTRGALRRMVGQVIRAELDARVGPNLRREVMRLEKEAIAWRDAATGGDGPPSGVRQIASERDSWRRLHITALQDINRLRDDLAQTQAALTMANASCTLALADALGAVVHAGTTHGDLVAQVRRLRAAPSVALPIVLEPAEEGGFTTTIPLLPGCVTEGDTAEEAVAHAQEAAELWLSTTVPATSAALGDVLEQVGSLRRLLAAASAENERLRARPSAMLDALDEARQIISDVAPGYSVWLDEADAVLHGAPDEVTP